MKRWPAIALAIMCAAARAEPSVPWTPDVATRHRIELLVDEAGLELPVTQWPLPSAAVAHALDELPHALPPPLDEARAQVRRALQTQAASRLSIAVRGRAEALSGFGDESTPGSSLGLRSSILALPHAVVQLGARIDDRPSGAHAAQFRLDQSAIATELGGVQLQAWSHRSWWGPGWQSSLVLGNNAPPFTGVGLQRASASPSASPWLAWLGPWNAEFFVAQAEGGRQAFFVGNRLTFRPWRHLELGLTRTAQWGGTGRPQSVGSFARMLLGVGVNPNTAAGVADDPANEMSGYDLRLRCGGTLRCAAYAQLIGEDATRGLPGRFLGLYGLEGWSADGTQRAFAEFAETVCGGFREHNPLRPCAYRNHAYPEGYTSDGRWIGAPFGPDSRVLTLGWMNSASGTTLRVLRGRVGSRVGSFSALDHDPHSSGPLLGASARQSVEWGASSLSVEFDWMRVSAPDGPHVDARLGLRWERTLDDAFDAGSARLGRALSLREGRRWSPLLVGAGLVVGAALLDRPVDDAMRRHDNPSSRGFSRAGDAVPVLGMGFAGVSWLMNRTTPEGNLAFAALGAGVTAFATAELTKLAVDRARPRAELGAGSFGDAPRRADSSFPSVHSAVAWAVLTPYAQRENAPWLYGAAALASAGRVVGRHHWVSDTVAGAVLGFAIGDGFYRAADIDRERTRPRVTLGPRSVAVELPFE